MGPVELPDRHMVGNDIPKTLAGKPDMQMKGRRFYLEGRFTQLPEVEIYGVIGRRTNGGSRACEHRHRRAVDMARRNKPDAGMTPDNLCKRIRIEEVFAIHM